MKLSMTAPRQGRSAGTGENCTALPYGAKIAVRSSFTWTAGN